MAMVFCHHGNLIPEGWDGMGAPLWNGNCPFDGMGEMSLWTLWTNIAMQKPVPQGKWHSLHEIDYIPPWKLATLQ
jgi:hypothetical protein